jgi:hypothetical protein
MLFVKNLGLFDYLMRDFQRNVIFVGFWLFVFIFLFFQIDFFAFDMVCVDGRRDVRKVGLVIATVFSESVGNNLALIESVVVHAVSLDVGKTTERVI